MATLVILTAVVVMTSCISTGSAQHIVLNMRINISDVTHTESCGVPKVNPTSTRIVGGTEAKPHSWPWAVQLLYGGSKMCGGSIIAPRWVITAAHCTKIKQVSLYTVVVGDHEYRVKEGTETSFRVVKIVSHEKYDPDQFHHDISLLQLNTPISFGINAQPVCLPNKPGTPSDACYAVGWGYTVGHGHEAGAKNPNVLQQVALPLYSDTACLNYLLRVGIKREHAVDMVCAGYYQGGMDTCQGDSGGCLVCKDGDRWLLQGLTSFGPKKCGTPKQPGVYTNVNSYISWIERHIGSDN